MARTRYLTSALFLVPLGLFSSHEAGAAGSLRAATPDVPTAQLPEGIHLTEYGRYTRDVCNPKKGTFCFSRLLMPAGWQPGDADPYGPEGTHHPEAGPAAGTMGPADILAAYNIPPQSKANGKIVAILDEPDAHAYNDLTQYRQGEGIDSASNPFPKCAVPIAQSPVPCFQQVTQTGVPVLTLDGGSGDGGSADTEAALDMDMISAACPDCSILFVDFPQYSDADVVKSAATARSLGAVATSISWGTIENYAGADPTTLGTFSTRGHLFLAAAGDWGYTMVNQGGKRTPSWPSSAADILAVGGTTLYPLSGGGYDEAVWNDKDGYGQQDVTTSGCSVEFGELAWQNIESLTSSACKMRATADLAAAANFNPSGTKGGIEVFDTGSGGWAPVEGTSASSPMVAAILVRLGLAEGIADGIATGTDNWIYHHPEAFHDLGSCEYPVDSKGSNTDAYTPSSCGILCTAEPGWDGVTGMGTPNGEVLYAYGQMVPDGGVIPDASIDTGASSSCASSASSSSTSSSSSTASSTHSTSESSSSSHSGSESSSHSGSTSSTGGHTTSGSTGTTATTGTTGTTGIVDGGMDSSASSSSSVSTGGGYDASSYSYSTTSETTSTSTTHEASQATKSSSSKAHSKSDGGVDGSVDGGEEPGSSGGCSCTESSETRTSLGSLGWLSVGLAALVGRRRRSVRR